MRKREKTKREKEGKCRIRFKGRKDLQKRLGSSIPGVVFPVEHEGTTFK